MRKKMTRIVSLTLAMLMPASGVLAESYPTKSPEEYSGELDYWVWGNYEQRCTGPFFEKYPNIKINFVNVSDYFVKLQTAIATGGDIPDIGNLEQTNRIATLDLNCWEVLDQDPYNADKSLLVDWSLPLMTNSKGEFTAVQIDNCIGGFAYNRQNAEQYFGISEVDEMEERFQTVEDYIEASELFKDGDGSHYMFGGAYDAFHAFYELNADEPNVLEDGTLNFDANIRPALEVVEKLVANNAVGDLQGWTPAWSAAFATDYATFFPAVTWMVYDNMIPNDPDAVDKYGLITPPGGGFSWGGTALSISSASPEDKKEMAWEFIRWFTLDEGGAQAFLDNNHAPTLYKPFYESDVYASYEDVAFGGQNTLAKYMEISENPNTKVRPMSQWDPIVINVLESIIVNEMAKGMTADDAVELLTTECMSRAPELKRPEA